MTDETELRDLLRRHEAADRPMRLDERTRILERIESVDHATTDSEVVIVAEDPVDVSASPLPPARATTRRKWPAVWLAAAAVILVVGSIAVLARSYGPDDSALTAGLAAEPTDSVTQESEATPAGDAVCGGPIAALVAGLDAWDGIDNWSRLTDQRHPEPHLPDLMAAALEAVAGVRPSSTVFEAETRFQAEFDAIDVADLSSVARRARAAAMHAATQAIGDEIRGDPSTFASCDAVTLITEAGDPATATSSGD